MMNKVIYFISIFTNSFILSLLTGCSSGNDESSLANAKTFVDPESTLEWASFYDGSYGYVNNLSYDEVMSFCDTLDAGGKSDWRMPSADETLDYIMRNTNIHEDTEGYRYIVASHSHDFSNVLNPQPGATYYGGANYIVFKEVPVIDYYDDTQRYYGETSIDSSERSSITVSIYRPDETSALSVLGLRTIDNVPSHSSFTCVRGTHSAKKIPAGTWINVEHQTEIIGSEQYVYGLKIVDNRHIRLSTVTFEGWHSVGNDYIDGKFIIARDAHFISSGITGCPGRRYYHIICRSSRSNCSRYLHLLTG